MSQRMERKAGIGLLAICCSVFILGICPEARASYGYQKVITIDHTWVPSTLSNFPLLISISSDNDLKTNVTSASGYDLVFKDSSGTKLDHELERWDGTTGTLVAWVRIPSLSSATDTVIDMFYGDSGVTTSQENKTGVWDSNYIGVWHLGESGNPYNDSTSNGNNSGAGTYPSQGTGEVGKAQDFDGSTNYINVTSTSLDLTGNKTIEAWAYPRTYAASGTGVDRRIVIKRTDANNCYQLTVNHFNSNSFAFGHKRSGVENTVFGGSNLSINTWYHVVGVYNGSSTIYLNGQSANSGNGIWGLGTSSDLRIGNRTDGDGFVNGLIDEVRISNIARSANWILAEYRNQSSPSTFYTLGAEAQVGFLYRKTITIDHTKVGSSCSSSLTDFPVLISISNDANLKTLANGGHVENSNGYDIIFRTLPQGTTYDHELESYDGTTGTLVAWVRIPTLSNSADTVLYMYYGNRWITTSTENAAGVWDSNFKGVWHLKESSNPYNDSTSNGFSSSSGTYPTQAAGQIGNGQGFASASSQYIARASTSLGITSSCTIELWVKPSTLTGGTAYTFLGHGGYSSGGFLLERAATNNLRFGYGGTDTWDGNSYTSTGSWSYLAVSVSSGTPQKFFLSSTSSSPSRVDGSGSFSATDPQTLAIARRQDTANEYIDGAIDEVRISSVARSDCWLETCYNNQNSPSTFYSVAAELYRPPTAVRLTRFQATGIDRGVHIEWETGYEVDNLGFHLYREEAGQPVRITPDLVAGSALLVGGRLPLLAGHSYSWIDQLPPGRTGARYWLEDIDLNGTRTLHGPELAQVIQAPRAAVSPPPSASSPLLGSLNRDECPKPAASPALAKTPPKFLGASARPSQTSGVRPALVLKASSTKAQRQLALAAAGAIKLRVNEDGWYRVDQPALVAAGLDSRVASRRLRLYADGEEVPLKIVGTTDRRFDTRDSIEFYGTALDTPFTGTRTYWLVEASGPGKRLRTLAGRGRRPAPASFPCAVELKERRNYFAALKNGEAENFFGSLVTAEGVDQTLVLGHLDPRAPGDASLHVLLQGVTTGAHRVQILLNGTEVAEVDFAGQAQGNVELSLPQSVLQEGENVVRLTAMEGETDVSLVDRVRITYWRTFTADGTRLAFQVRGSQVVTVDGFSMPRIRVMDVTVPGSVYQVAGTVFQQGLEWAVRVRVPGSGERKLLAFTDEGVKAPGEIRADAPSEWSREEGGADLVIISHHDFLGSLGPLEALRKAQGLTVAEVDVDDLYDEFSFGEKSPAAIKGFLRSAKAVWRTPPRFVLLAGDASFDPKDYLGLGESDFVPTKLVDMSYHETASDDWFVDFDGNGIPSLAIGRLPVQTAKEAGEVVSKIVARETAGADAWTTRVLMVADQNEGYDFEATTGDLRQLFPPEVSVQEIFAGQDADAAAHVREAIEGGQALVVYLGHGSVGVWRGNLLSTDKAYTLTNAPRLPVFLDFTCLNAFFQDVYMESLGEALLKAPGGGAAAVWASSTLTDPANQVDMAKEMLRLLLNGEGLTIGEAAARVKAATSDLDVRRSWILLGDPAQRMPAGF